MLAIEHPIPTHKLFKNLKNITINELTVISYAGVRGDKKYWYCMCSCGQATIASSCNLQSGQVTSCGHISEERFGVIKHGRTESQEFVAWTAMKDRCSKKSGLDYERYVARGITVCERWLESFENFYEDMGDKPSKKHSLDRIDNNLGYYKENCKWATMKEQSNNRRTNVIIEYNGESLTQKEWSEKLNIPEQTIYLRRKKGLSVDEILKPTRKK